MRILAVSDSALLASCLRVAISGVENVQVVDVAGPLDVVAKIRQHHPDLTLIYMACSWDMMLELTRIITSEAIETNVIILGAPDGDTNYLHAIEAGASGCIPQSASFDFLQQTINAVSRGEVVCTPRLAYCLFERLSQLGGNDIELEENVLGSRLTTRELEIVDLIARGKNNHDIALHLNLSIAAVKKRVHKVLEKMRVRRSQLSTTAPRERSVSGLTPSMH
jgi:two-component system NarL family response regulator